jgi:hypothetical protein
VTVYRNHQSDSFKKEEIMLYIELSIGLPLLAIAIQEDKTFTASELCLDRIEFIFATQTLTLTPPQCWIRLSKDQLVLL